VLQPLTDWTPAVDTWDQATFWTPPATTREQISQRLYGDPNHFGGFDIVGDKHVRMRNFEGVAADVATAMRTALDERLRRDVGTVVGILQQRRIADNDEWRLLDTTVWWSVRGDLTNSANRSYFDAYLDELDTHRLTEWGLFSNTTRPASEWLVVEAEEKQWAIYPLIARRSSRGTVRSVNTGEQMDEFGRVRGSITASTRTPWHEMPRVVGGYAFRSGENRTGIETERHGTGVIQVGEQIVDESSATRAEIALRNSSHRGARVMIPGGDGHFYGYTISSPNFWDENYVQPTDARAERLENFWWHYPGTVFVAGGQYQPEVGSGGAAERSQRTEILTRTLAAGLESLRGLDFDVLSMLTLDQRITVLGLAVGSVEAADASLVARVLYSTPNAEFPALERRLSTNGMLTRIASMPLMAAGALAMIGRIFTVKAVESMRVPGESLEGLPEFRVGFDNDGYYHYADTTNANAPSRTLPPSDLGAGEVGIGREQALPEEAAGPISRTVLNIQPAYLRLGGEGISGGALNFGRGLLRTLVVNDGSPRGPFLPTQLVRVTTLGTESRSRIVSALEAVALLMMPTGEILARMVSAHGQFGGALLAATGLGRAFGPALLEGLAEGGGTRVVATALAEAAASQAGRSALVNAGLVAGMSAVESNRAALQRSAEGRAFLEIYDVALIIWVAHDVTRLIVSGLVPRLGNAINRVIETGAGLRDAIMPLRDEVEAMRRAISRYASPAEAAEAAMAEGPTMAAPREARPGFSAMLRVSRGEVAAERVVERLAGTETQAVGRRVFDRLGGLVSRTEAEAATAASDTTAGAAERATAARNAAERAAAARFAVAQRAGQLRPEARAAFLQAVDGVIATRPNSLGSLADLLTSAASSRQPNVFIAEVQTLASRRGVSDEALRVLGQKVRQGSQVLDLQWLNQTSISDQALDFLGRDRRTPWNLFRRAAADPSAGDVMRYFRSSARGAGAEMVAEGEAARLGTGVRRQVVMGSSELDYEITVGGRRHGFEVKGWTRETWDDALDAAIGRLNHRSLSDAERRAVRKIDTMLGQLQDAQSTTRQAPYLGFTDALPPANQARLRRVLESNGLGNTQFVPLSEARIKEAAAGTIGEALGVPRPSLGVPRP
jgi:hypothetical protein